MVTDIGLIAAAIAYAGGAIAAGMGESTIGPAAVGAVAEDEKNFGRSLLMLVVPESLAIFGFVIALLIMFLF